MKRERKYRVWDGKQMIYFDLGDIDNGGMIGLPTWDNPIALLDREVMDFVGLKDSKGISIYEGDILNYNDYRVGNAATSEGKLVFVVSWEEETGCGCCGHSVGYDLEKSANIEVLGNIYENPDLLNNKL